MRNAGLGCTGLLAVVCLSADVRGDIVVDQTFDDAVTDLVAYGGSSLVWYPARFALNTAEGAYVTDINPIYSTLKASVTSGTAGQSQSNSYILTEDIVAVRIRFINLHPSDALQAGSPNVGQLAIGWYDSADLLSPPSGTGNRQDNTIYFTAPAVPAASVVDLDVDVTGIAGLGDTGDAICQITIASMWNPVPSQNPGLGNYGISSVSLVAVPEPATMGLLALGLAMVSALRRRRR